MNREAVFLSATPLEAPATSGDIHNSNTRLPEGVPLSNTIMSYNINLQHIVFRTKHSLPTIPENTKRMMLMYIYKTSESMGVKVKRINAYLNHVHILVDFPVTMQLPEYVRKIKSTATLAFKHHEQFPAFDGWSDGYGSFSVSYYEKDRIINYIKGQEEHHRHKTFAEELKELFGKELVDNDPYWKKNWEE